MIPPSAFRLSPADLPGERDCHAASDTTSGHDQLFITEHAEEIFSIIQHDDFATVTGGDHWQYESSSSVTIRSTLSERMRYRSRPSASTRHALNDRIDLRFARPRRVPAALDRDAGRPRDLVNMCHFSIPLDRWATN